MVHLQHAFYRETGIAGLHTYCTEFCRLHFDHHEVRIASMKEKVDLLIKSAK